MSLLEKFCTSGSEVDDCVGVDQGLILESGLDVERAVLDEDIGVIASCLFELVVAVHMSIIFSRIDKYWPRSHTQTRQLQLLSSTILDLRLRTRNPRRELDSSCDWVLS